MQIKVLGGLHSTAPAQLPTYTQVFELQVVLKWNLRFHFRSCGDSAVLNNVYSEYTKEGSSMYVTVCHSCPRFIWSQVLAVPYTCPHPPTPVSPYTISCLGPWATSPWSCSGAGPSGLGFLSTFTYHCCDPGIVYLPSHAYTLSCSSVFPPFCVSHHGTFHMSTPDLASGHPNSSLPLESLSLGGVVLSGDIWQSPLCTYKSGI